MRITCDRCLRRYDIPDGAMGSRKVRARCKCGSRIVIQNRSVTTDGPDSAADSKQLPTRWFVDITSWEPIAMDVRQLVRAFAAGRIDADTLVWCKGMPDWRRLRDVDELAERLLGVASGATTRTTKPPRPTPVEGIEPPARAPGKRRSITPKASYIVASAGDTMRLKKPERSELPPAEGSLGTVELPAGVLSAAVLSEGLSSGAAADANAPSETVAGLAPASSTADAGAPSSEASERPSAIPPPLPVTQSRADIAPAPSQPEPNVVAAEPAPAATTATATRAASTKSDPASAGRGTQQRHRKRRRSVSEETPAQKPSSLSVRLTTPARSHRGRSVLAAAGVLAIVGFIWQASVERSTKHSLVPSQQEGMTEEAPPITPRPREAEPNVRDVVAEQVKVQEPPTVPSEKAAEPPSEPPSVPVEKTKQSLLPPPVRPQNSVPRPPAPAPKRVEPPRRAAAAPVVEKAAPPGPAEPSPEKSPAPEAASPSEGAIVAKQDEASSAPKPSPFDTAKAEQQMAFAAWIASTCGQMGETRGEGQVKVLIEPWGRVVRVTHLAPEFAGTPVGHCVTQAYQQITIPPFEGGTRSLVGSFVIK